MVEILGLPAHILFLHAVVAFAPVAGLAGTVYALRPSWQRVLEWPVVILTVAVTGPWSTSRTKWLAPGRDIRWLVGALRVLTVLAGLVLIYQVVVTGHSGTEAVWTDRRSD